MAENDTAFTETPSTSAETATSIQAGLPAAGESIPLPPIQTPPEEPVTPEELAQEMGRLDWVLSFLIVALGFLLASFPVRNTDFFLHLAQGRLYGHGHFNFGTDPFSYSTTNYWANSSWLYDLLLYGITTICGGVDSSVAGMVLVVIKGLLIALLAWFMLKTSRPDLPRWAPALCAGLALVVMSPRFFYQPTLLSFLFLAMTLYILQRPRHEELQFGDPRRSGKSPLRVYWLLPVLFALWANLDAWWLLGPATVALFLVGQALQSLLAPVHTGEDAPELAQLGSLLAVLVVGLAAGLVNPHHYHVFALPAVISPATPFEVYGQDRIFKILFQQPFRDEYFTAGQGTNIAGLSYFALLGVGLLSFVLSMFAEWRWWRLLVWLGFALLSYYRVRCVPYFAVAAGPITALNLQDFAAFRFGRLPRVDRTWRAFSLGGRILSLVAVVAVILAAWPGWLHGRPSDSSQMHRVGWEVHIDPSLRAAAGHLRAWREQGLLKDGENGFSFSPDIANYCAWFGADPQTGMPREKSFFDYRLELFPRTVSQSYLDIRQGLGSIEALGDISARPVNWQDIFRKQHITHVIVNRNDPDFPYAWVNLLPDWSQWALVTIADGRTVVFRWNDPLKRATPSSLPRLDPGLLAFGPAAVRAPESGPSQNVQAQDMIALFLHGPPPASPHEDEAARYIEYFNLIKERWYRPFLASSDIAQWAGTVGLAGKSPGVGTVAAPATFALSFLPMFYALNGNGNAIQLLMTGKDYGPAAAPMLAVRAARQAILESPNNAGGYMRLAMAYAMLWHDQEDYWTARPAGNVQYLRQQLRAIQIATALEKGLRLHANDYLGQKTLLELYYVQGYRDLALERFEAMIRSGNSPMLGESRDEFKQRKEGQDKAFKDMQDDLMRRRNEFELESANKPPLEKAHLALRRGLARKAREVLDQADISQMNWQAIDLQINLHLSTGASSLERGLDELREALASVASQIGPNYERYGFLLEAAAGNYAESDKYIEEAIHKLEREVNNAALTTVRGEAFGGFGAEVIQQTNFWLQNISLLADYKVLRAMLALEAGDTALAARSCEDALNMNNGQPFEFESKRIAANYLRLLKAAGGAK